MQGNLFWQLRALSDAALLDGLNRTVLSGRRMLAELLAHLCEVEHRRLHLDAGYPSMFAYCTARLGLSEDEAYRRIEVARLAQRAPIVFALVAEGRLSLSAAALLRPHLRAPNLAELIEAVSGKSVQMAREALAALHPRPDVADEIRKLPERIKSTGSSPARLLFDAKEAPTPRVDEASASHGRGALAAGAVPSRERDERSPALTPTIAPAARPPHAQAFEPLSPCRYKVSFTASRGLKEKLELARDLMRHSVPGGEIAAIMERALDLLIADVMKTRFGSGARQKRSASSKQTPSAPPQTTPPPEFAEDAKRPEQSAQPPPPATDQHSNRPETIPRALRRAVLERDGLRCTWRGPDGTRCTARAWLERDHIHLAASAAPPTSRTSDTSAKPTTAAPPNTSTANTTSNEPSTESAGPLQHPHHTPRCPRRPRHPRPSRRRRGSCRDDRSPPIAERKRAELTWARERI